MFNAGQSDSGIARLTDKAMRAQWSPDQDIDWTLPVALPSGVRPAVYTDMVSQLYYAEEATIHVLGQMMQSLPDLDARQYVCTQAIDEARHAQVYRQYLCILGDVAPIDPGLQAVFEKAFDWRGPSLGLVVALNLVMENEALAQQKKRITTLPCPLFKQINQAIIRDEARHASFGILYVERKAPEASQSERAQILEWIACLWQLWREANAGRYAHDGEQILRLDPAELAHRGRRVIRALAALGLGDAREVTTGL
jgi:para-aminobenzoate N-oxygenase AurF